MRLSNVLSLLILLAMTGCGNGIEAPERIFSTSLDIREPGGLANTVFSTGDEINFVLSVTNLTNAPQSISFSNTQTFDILVFNSTGGVEWRWGEGKTYNAAITTLNFDPYATITDNATWNTTGHKLGFYNAQGFIPSSYESNLPYELRDPSQLRSSSRSLNLQ